MATVLLCSLQVAKAVEMMVMDALASVAGELGIAGAPVFDQLPAGMRLQFASVGCAGQCSREPGIADALPFAYFCGKPPLQLAVYTTGPDSDRHMPHCRRCLPHRGAARPGAVCPAR